MSNEPYRNGRPINNGDYHCDISEDMEKAFDPFIMAVKIQHFYDYLFNECEKKLDRDPEDDIIKIFNSFFLLFGSQIQVELSDLKDSNPYES